MRKDNKTEYMDLGITTISILWNRLRRFLSLRITQSLIQRHWPNVFLLALSFSALTWFSYGKLKGFWDVNPVIFPLNSMLQSDYVWFPYLNSGGYNVTGYTELPYKAFLSVIYLLVGKSASLAEAISWWALFLATGLFMYQFLSYNLRRSSASKIGPLVGSILYMYNPYNTFQGWGDSAPYAPLVMASLPLFLLVIELFLDSDFRIRIYLFAAVLISPLLFSFLVLSLPVILICTIFVMYFSRTIFRFLKLLLYFFPLALFVNGFWIFPSLFLTLNGYTPVGGLSSAYYSYLSVVYWSKYTPVWITILMLGEPSLYLNWWTYSSLFTNLTSPVIVLLVIVTLLAISILFIKNSASKKGLIPFLLVSIIGVFLAAGVHLAPIGWFYKWALYNIPLFQTANYPTQTWTTMTIFGYAGMLSLSINSIKNTKRSGIGLSRFTSFLHLLGSPLRRHLREIMAAIVVFSLLVSSFPMISGGILTNKYNTNVDIPNYVQNSINYVNRNSYGSKTLLLPGVPSSLTGFNWSGGYMAYNPMVQFTNQTLISNFIPGDNITNALFLIPGSGYEPTLFNESISSLNDYDLLLKINAVKYIILMTDYKYFPNSPLVDSNLTEMLSFLLQLPGVSKISPFGSDIIFQVESAPSQAYSTTKLLNSMLLSENYLNLFSTSMVTFSSPFTGAIGSVIYENHSLELNAILNKSVPWEVFTNIYPFNLTFDTTPMLLVEGSGTNSDNIPLLISNGSPKYPSLVESQRIDGLSFTFSSLPPLRTISQIEFTNINGTDRLYGIYFIYDLLALPTLANLTSILPLSIYQSEPVAISSMTYRQLIQQAHNETVNLVKPFQINPKTNLTTTYESSNLTTQTGSSNQGLLRISNEGITVSINNSEPWTDVVNLAPLSTKLTSLQSLIIHSTKPIGMAVGNSANFTSYRLVGVIAIKIGPFYLNYVELPSNYNLLTRMWIFIQPFSNVTISGIDIISPINMVYSISSGEITAFSNALTFFSLLSDAKVKVGIHPSASGSFLIVWTQLYSPQWQATVKVSSLDAKFDIHHILIDGLWNGYSINLTAIRVHNISLIITNSVQKPITTSFEISSFAIVAVFGLFLYYWKREHD